MPVDQLQEFFHEKKERAKPANIDWQAKRDAWIDAVIGLYSKIEDDFLKAAKDDVHVARHDKTVVEDYVGEYHVPNLKLTVGDEHVVFSPKGVNIVGAKGRIDVYGDRGDASIVWNGDGEWQVVLARTPALQLVPLTPDSLTDLLRRVMRP